MTLADRILTLRKREGLSQEQLAEKLGVSRQAVSKWESAAAAPEIDKILLMSQVFGVTTDYLLKGDENPGTDPYGGEDGGSNNGEAKHSEEGGEKSVRYVSMQEALEFVEMMQKVRHSIGIGVLLCIMSPIPLIALAGMEEGGFFPLVKGLSSDGHYILATVLLLVMIAIAVAIFVLSGEKSKRFKYIETEKVDMDSGTRDRISRMYEERNGRLTVVLVVGIVLCILAVVPIIVFSIFDNDFLMIEAVAGLLAIVAAAVYIIIYAAMEKQSYEQLLQMGDYTDERKAQKRGEEKVGGIYWPIVTAIYLGISFYTMDWHRTWIIWPVAGVLFAGISNFALRRK